MNIYLALALAVSAAYTVLDIVEKIEGGPCIMFYIVLAVLFFPAIIFEAIKQMK